MSSLLKSIDSRTKLVGENRLELLMFYLSSSQMFAINVFKVQEVVQMPHLNAMPRSHPSICGVTHLRNTTIPVIDLAAAIGLKPLKGRENCNLIVTEYNRSIQAFLIGAVDRIVNLNWESILPPPSGAGRSHFLTAITQLDDRIVEIVDVERVLADIVIHSTNVTDGLLDGNLVSKARDQRLKLLVADDSMTAIQQVRETVAHIGLDVVAVQDGLQALNLLNQWVAEGRDIYNDCLMLITDAEMPEMDGYRLTHEIRSNPALKDMHVVLHTSLSGSFNKAMVEKVGCDGFLSKFQPDELATVVQERLRSYLENQ